MKCKWLVFLDSVDIYKMWSYEMCDLLSPKVYFQVQYKNISWQIFIKYILFANIVSHILVSEYLNLWREEEVKWKITDWSWWKESREIPCFIQVRRRGSHSGSNFALWYLQPPYMVRVWTCAYMQLVHSMPGYLRPQIPCQHNDKPTHVTLVQVHPLMGAHMKDL